MVKNSLPIFPFIPSKGVKPRLLKNVLTSSKWVSPGMMPQKQGTLQFNGSLIRGSSVARAISGSRVSIGVGELVGEWVALGTVIVIVGFNVEVGRGVVVAGGMVRDGGGLTRVGCGVSTAGTHPAKANVRISKIDKHQIDFIIGPFL
jgi:hypothetical protein